MANEIPETAADADARGLKKFSDEEWEKYESELAAAGILEFERPIKCSEHPVGTKCLELPCLQHIKAIIYCDENHNCVDRRKFPC